MIERSKLERELALAYITGWQQAQDECDRGEARKSQLVIEPQSQRYATRRIIQIEAAA